MKPPPGNPVSTVPKGTPPDNGLNLLFQPGKDSTQNIPPTKAMATTGLASNPMSPNPADRAPSASDTITGKKGK